MTWKHNIIINKKELEEWLDKNLIYCEDTHSFVHRLFDRIKANKKSTYKDAQFYAFQVLEEMIKEYNNPKRFFEFKAYYPENTKKKSVKKIKTKSRLGYIGNLPIPRPPKKYREEKK
jgi:hypothetical protein